MEGTIGDDFSAEGLSVWCFDHTNETLRSSSYPTRPGPSNGPRVTVTPVAVGGNVKSKNTNDFSFPVTNLKHTTYTAPASA